MARSWDEIVELTRQMQDNRGPVVERMRQILIRYDGEYVIPIPEMPTEPAMPLLTPMLVGELVDTFAMKACSVMPMISSPATRKGVQTGKGSIHYANVRRGALEATYYESKWPIARRRYMRHLSAYQTFSIVVLPDHKEKMPRVRVREPLCTYPEPNAFEEMRPPLYVAFVNTYSAAYLRAQFPECHLERGGPIPREDTTLDQWDVVEWHDDEQTVYGILGPAYASEHHTSDQRGVSMLYTGTTRTMHMPLGEPIPNRIGKVRAICPESPSLGKIGARLAALTGMLDFQSHLMALDYIASERAVFPDTYVVGEANEVPTLAGNNWIDGRTGQVNLVSGARTVGVLRQSVDPATGILTDRLERSFRASTGLMAQASGETRSNLRTGRAMDTLTGIAVDPRILEMHELDSMWAPYINEVILEMYRTWWPSKKYELFTGMYGDRELIEFEPSRHVETCKTTVAYAIPGADVIQLTQILGSMAGANMISLETTRELHPWVGNPEEEKATLTMERLDTAMLEGIMVQVQQGGIPPAGVARLIKRIRKGEALAEAIEKVDAELREEQAERQAEMAAAQQPVPAGQPGLAPPESVPMPMEQGGPPVQVPDNVTQLQQLMSAMRPTG